MGRRSQSRVPRARVPRADPYSFETCRTTTTAPKHYYLDLEVSSARAQSFVCKCCKLSVTTPEPQA